MSARASRRVNIKPQVDKYTFPDGHSIFLLAEGRSGKSRLRHRPSELRHVQQLLQPDARAARSVEEQGHVQSRRLSLPKKLDEEVARLHLEKIGVKLTKLTKAGRLPRRSGGRAVQARALSVLERLKTSPWQIIKDIYLRRNPLPKVTRTKSPTRFRTPFWTRSWRTIPWAAWLAKFWSPPVLASSPEKSRPRPTWTYSASRAAPSTTWATTTPPTASTPTPAVCTT